MHRPQLPLPTRRQIRTDLRQFPLIKARLLPDAAAEQISQLRRDGRGRVERRLAQVQSMSKVACRAEGFVVAREGAVDGA